MQFAPDVVLTRITAEGVAGVGLDVAVGDGGVVGHGHVARAQHFVVVLAVVASHACVNNAANAHLHIRTYVC